MEQLSVTHNQFINTRRPPLHKRLFQFQRYHLTLEGVAFIILMGLIGFAGWHSGANLLYLIFAMLIGFFLVQGILVWRMLVGLGISRILPNHIIAREEVAIPVLIKNRKRILSSYGLRLMEYLPGNRLIGSGFAFKVPPRGEIQTEYRAIFPERGMHKLNRLEIVTRYPFGFAERASIFPDEDEVLAYPSIYDVKDILEDFKADVGEYESRHKGGGTELYGLRKYEHGDSARFIHWRSSVKAQRTMVMEHEKEERRKAVLLLRNNLRGKRPDAGLKASFEKALTFAASLAKLLIEQGYEIQLATDSGVVPFGSGTNHLYRILRTLALLQLTDKGPVHHLDPAIPGTVYNISFNGGSDPEAAGRHVGIKLMDWEIVEHKFSRTTMP